MAADVCRILGINLQSRGDPNVTVALRKLDASQRGLYRIQTLGGLQKAAVVSESGLYKLIMRSDKDTARPFQDWVTKEVLPSVRKTGGYLLNEEAREVAGKTRESGAGQFATAHGE